MLHFSSSLRKRNRTILCPVSLRQDEVSWAVQVAYSLAKQRGAQLVLLNAYLPEASYEQQELLNFARRIKQLRQQMGELARVKTVPADAASAIVREAEDCDLIVMRRSQPDWLVGRLVESLSQRVTRLAPCPVLLIDHFKSRYRQRYEETADSFLELPAKSQRPDFIETVAPERILPYRTSLQMPADQSFASSL